MRALAAALVATCLAACGGGGGGGSSPSPATTASAPVTRTISVASSYTGVAYPVTIYTPAGYATSTDSKAVIYAMDHELQFDVIRGYVEAYGIDAIVVSIGNLGGDRRFVDFDLPGAEPYFRFLTLELIPLVEAQYRVDRSRRTLMGYSLSGLAAVIAIFEENPASRYFSGYVITDPSLQFHTSELYAFEQRLWDTTHSLPITVKHCSTSGGSPYADFPAQVLSRGYGGLHYNFQVYTLTHAAVLAPCINDGLHYVFGLG
jgi:hypothetical protein